MKMIAVFFWQFSGMSYNWIGPPREKPSIGYYRYNNNHSYSRHTHPTIRGMNK